MMLDRRDIVQQLLIDRGDLLVVPGLGSATYDVAAAGDHPLNFYLWGAMGGTAMIALGLALARPDRRVLAIPGDGDMLMGIGSLATIGVQQPKNLVIVVLDNARYGETGMQSSHTDFGVDFAAMALACCFRRALTVTRGEDIAEVRTLLHSGQGPILVNAKIKPDDVPRVLPLRDGHAIKHRFMAALNKA
jgi:thiamine pyrophosphate-dependent acetolactate synthase large subunit-like protein